MSGATYEVYVSGVNSAGVGEPSTRIVFRTASKQIEDLIEESEHPYNQTQCCLNSGIREDCKSRCIRCDCFPNLSPPSRSVTL